tara:strand:+ start:192 stop:653 length:462 start_codon:yes stop_codon:yes gene_type:complete
MNDIYRPPVTKDESILLILKELVNHNIDVCKLIIQQKKSLEAKETMEYYYDRWENIAGSFYRLRETDEDKYSLICDHTTFVVKKDHNPIFYNLTGISYQVIDLIHLLIKLHKVDRDDTQETFIWNYKYWLERDDKLYSVLTNKIMRAMNESYE